MSEGYGEVTGKVTIADVGVERDLVAVSFKPFDLAGSDDGNGNSIQVQQVVGNARSETDGTYTMRLEGFQDEVIVIALDDYGEVWRPNRSYLVGDRIRPTAGNETGYVYVCTVAGVSGSTEPTWWINDGGATLGAVGSATFEAREAWWPVAHAPIVPEWNQVGTVTLDPLFPHVTLLCHADPEVAEQALDPHWENVSLIMEGEDFYDNGPHEMWWGVAYNAVISGAQKKVGDTAMFFDGHQDHLWRNWHPALRFENQDFTIEFWAYPVSAQPNYYGSIICQRTTNSNNHQFSTFLISNSMEWGFIIGGSGSSKVACYLGANSAELNTWQHIVFQRRNGVLEGYKNGQLLRSVNTTPNDYNSTADIKIGAFDYNIWHQSYYHGYLDHLRVTKGVARYNGAFIPDEEVYPRSTLTTDEDFINVVNNSITFSKRRFAQLDTSGVAKFGTGAMKIWNGWIDIFANDDEFHVVQGDYTLECFARIDQLTGDAYIMDCRSVALDYGPVVVVDLSDNELTLWMDEGNEQRHAPIPTLGQYVHMAVCRHAGITRFFVGGVQAGTDIVDQHSVNLQKIRVGAAVDGDTNAMLEGYVDEIRFTQAARYTQDFEPPTQAFPDSELSDTALYPVELDSFFPWVISLIHCEGGDGSALSSFDLFENQWDLEGDVSISGDTSQWGLGSLKFDGSGDYIIRRGSLVDGDRFIPVAAGPFTLDLWVYPQSLSGRMGLVSQYNGSDGDRFLFQIFDGQLYAFHGAGASATGITTLTLNQWHYVSLVFDQNKEMRAYLDGSLEFTLDLSAITGFANHWTAIGARYDGGSADHYFSGYLDDIRLTRAARHFGSSSDVPTEAHPDTRFQPGFEPTLLDPFFFDRVFSCHMEDGDGAEDFVDAVTGAYGLSTAQDRQLGTTAVSKFGTGAVALLNAGDYLFRSPDTGVDFGDDFTLEAWINVNDLSVVRGVWMQGAPSENSERFQLNINTNGSLGLYCTDDGVNIMPSTHSAADVIQALTWHHVAMVKQGLEVRCFVDGVGVVTGLLSANWQNSSKATRIGYARSGSVNRHLSGYLDEIRYTKAVRYWDDFPALEAPYPDQDYDPNEILGSGGGIPPIIADPHLEKVQLLIPFDGEYGQTEFPEVARGTFLEVLGPSLTNAQSHHYPMSAYFDGVDDAINLPVNTFDVADQDFTIEWWEFLEQQIPDQGAWVHVADWDYNNDTGWFIYYFRDGANYSYYLTYQEAAGSPVSIQLPLPGALSTGAWQHCALSRVGSDLRFYVNGVKVAESNLAPTTFPTSNFQGVIGARGPSNYYFQGYLSDFRFTLGVARYAGDFIAPADPFPAQKYTEASQPWKLDPYWDSTYCVLNMNDDLVDNGNGGDVNWQATLTAFAPESKHGTHSLALGQGSYLTSAGMPDFGTADFSIECWVKGVDKTASQYLWDNRDGLTGNANAMLVYCPTGEGVVRFWQNGTTRIESTMDVRDGEWHHICLHRKDGITRLKIDGIWQGAWTDPTDYQHGATGLVFGTYAGDPGTSNSWNGQLDDIRINLGESRYDGSFNPPVFQHPAGPLENRQLADTRVLNWTDEMLVNPSLVGSDEQGWTVDVPAGSTLDYGWRGGDANVTAKIYQDIPIPPGAFAVGFGGLGRNTFTRDHDAGTAYVYFFDKDRNRITKGATIHGMYAGDISSEWHHCLVPEDAVFCRVRGDATRSRTGGSFNHGMLNDLGCRFLTVTGDPIPVTHLAIENHDFETGNLQGWTALTGTPSLTTNTSLVSQGTYALGVGESSGYAVFQDVDLPEGNFHMMNVTCGYNRNYYDTDTGRLRVQALNAGGAAIADFDAMKPVGVASAKLLATVFERIPAGTKKLRIILQIVRGESGTGLNMGLDDVQASVIEDPDGTLAQYLGR